MWTVGRFDTLKEENGEKEEEGGGGQEPREVRNGVLIALCSSNTVYISGH